MASNGNVNGEPCTVPFLINGQEIRTERTFDVVNPATGKLSHRCSSASSANALAAVDAAATAFQTWRNTKPHVRREILLKAAEVILQRQDELAQYHMSETGAPRPWADFNLKVARDLILDVAGRVAAIEGRIPTAEDEGVGALVFKEPLGVVLAVAPWNAPYILGTRSVLFPIAAGNTAILKASELSPRTHWAICSIFKDAGLPDGVLNVIVHEPANAASITELLVAHPAIKKINFTGSTVVGRIMGRLAGENLKPILLELGGKAPVIVWEDADLDLAADQCALGAFLNSGQICMSTERILVHKNIREKFEARFVASVEKFFPSKGDALVLVQALAVEKNKKLAKDALNKGASLLIGDVDTTAVSTNRLRPIVVNDVTSDMDIYKTESFGPTVSLIQVETEEEALRLANDTDYGLTSAVFTEDLRRGLRLARGIEAGAVHINGMTVHDEAVLPHGGAKSSGYGRFNASALEEWVRTKSVTFKY